MTASRPLPRRILLTADTVGGVWDYALELARGLAEQGVEVVLATLGRPRPFQDDQARGIPNLTLEAREWKLEWMPDAWDDVQQSGRWLVDLERTTRPDVVHLNGFCHAACPFRAPVMVVAHSCVLSWWEHVRHEFAPPEWARYRREVQGALSRAHVAVAPSRSMARDVERHYGVPSVRVIPNGRDGALRYRPDAVKEPFVLAAGRLWDEAKNFTALDSAAAGLTWPVCFAGDTAGPRAESFAPSSGFLLGRLSSDELASWMRRASIYVLPAKYEPFGLSALEAAQCGCALVLGDIPSLRENWDGAALFVNPSDPASLRQTIDGLIGSPALRAHYRRCALDRAAAFSGQRMVAAYLELYSDLLVGRSRPAATA